MKTADRWRIALFVATIVALGFNVWFFVPRQTKAVPVAKTSWAIPDVIPLEGWCKNQRFKDAKLNPDRVIWRLKGLYKEMELYKSRKGAYPNRETALLDDMEENPVAYGYKSGLDGIKEMRERNRTPDMQYADSHFSTPHGVISTPFYMIQKRPDGTKNGTPHPVGTRDVLAYSDIYYFRDWCIKADGTSTQNPTGFYVVLWEGGEVTKVPFDQVRFAYPQRAGAPSECFPRQAGIPATTYTEAEMWAKVLPFNKDGSNPNVLPVAK